MIRRLIIKVLRQFKANGICGVLDAIFRKLTPSDFHPIDVAIDAITQEADFSVIQLGAFIGNTRNDPLFMTLRKRMKEINGKLIVVEPVKMFYDELIKNYEDIPGVAFENVAISEHSGPATIYRLGVDPVPHGYPDWMSQLSSLKTTRMTELWDQYEVDKRMQEFYLKHRIEETVQCITFSELMNRHGLTHLDLLQIDVEGYELEILQTIDFKAFPTRFVNYESVLLNREKPNTEKLMAKWGYHFVDYDQDTFCYKAGDKHLIRCWKIINYFSYNGIFPY